MMVRVRQDGTWSWLLPLTQVKHDWSERHTQLRVEFPSASIDGMSVSLLDEKKVPLHVIARVNRASSNEILLLLDVPAKAETTKWLIFFVNRPELLWKLRYSIDIQATKTHVLGEVVLQNASPITFPRHCHWVFYENEALFCSLDSTPAPVGTQAHVTLTFFTGLAECVKQHHTFQTATSRLPISTSSCPLEMYGFCQRVYTFRVLSLVPQENKWFPGGRVQLFSEEKLLLGETVVPLVIVRSKEPDPAPLAVAAAADSSDPAAPAQTVLERDTCVVIPAGSDPQVRVEWKCALIRQENKENALVQEGQLMVWNGHSTSIFVVLNIPVSGTLKEVLRFKGDIAERDLLTFTFDDSRTDTVTVSLELDRVEDLFVEFSLAVQASTTKH